MKLFYLFLLFLPAACIGTPGISEYRTTEGKLAYKTECSPLETNICNEKAHNFCASQGKKVQVLGREIKTKYGTSTVITHANGFETQENISDNGRAYKVEVLEGQFTCIS